MSLRYSIKSYIKDWNQGALPGEEFKEAGRDTQEGLEAAAILEAAGYDAFNADTGSYDAWYWAHPPLYQKHGCNLDLTEKLKKVVTVPVIVAGRMDLPEMAAAAIAEGKADMIALGRGLLAEPQWVNKTFEGRTDNLRPCLGCHDGCFGRISLGRPISCAVNPACGRERDYSIESARNMRTVVVIGGGVAGMEASRVASIRGHEVRLYEKNDHLGGHLLEASVPAFKRDVARLLKWYESELVRLGVNIHLGKEFAVEHLLPKESSVVLVATGSQYAIASIPGSEKGKMATATEFLLRKRQPVDPIVVVGGGLTGCETALWLAQQNHNVTIIEMLEDLMQSGIPVFYANRTMLLDLLKFHEVKWLTNTTILGIGDEKVDLIDKSFRRSEIPARTVVMATGLVSDPRLFQSVRNMTSSAYIIGDAKRPGNIMTAIWDAYEIARNI